MSAPSRGTHKSGTHNISEPSQHPLQKADSCSEGANTNVKDINNGDTPISKQLNSLREQENGINNSLISDVVDRHQSYSSGNILTSLTARQTFPVDGASIL